MQSDIQTSTNKAQSPTNYTKVVLAYGFGFGALAAVANIVYLLVNAFYEAEFLRTPVPMNGLGFVDYTGVVRSAEAFFPIQALPTTAIILAGVFVSAFLAASITRRFFIGMSVAGITLALSFSLYVIASALVAQYIIEPALPVTDDTLAGLIILVDILLAIALLILASIVSVSSSALGTLV